jgi:hypothetical protein
MRLRSLFRRRPTASLVISMISLFVALGGASYAAVSLPRNSVGTGQIRKNAVTAQKMALHTIGLQRIDQTKIQVRISGTCPGNSALNTVAQSGRVTCHSTLPQEFGASSDPTGVTGSSTTVTSKVIPAGNYLFTAVPYATISGAGTGQVVSVSCTLSAASGASQTRTVTNTGNGEVAIPMTFASTVGSPQGTATVSCSHSETGTAPTVSVQSTLNAVATQSNS